MPRLSVGSILTVGGAVFVVDEVYRSGHVLTLRCIKSGGIYSGCGAQVEVDLYTASFEMTDQDHSCLDAGAGGADFVCVSFADTPELVIAARNALTAAGSRALVVAKVESPVAASNLLDLADVADGLLLARGDLSAFYDDNSMEVIGDQLVSAAQAKGRFSIFASDYFTSLMTGQTHSLSRQENDRLERAIDRGVDYLVINETATSERWSEIARIASGCQDDNLLGSLEIK